MPDLRPPQQKVAEPEGWGRLQHRAEESYTLYLKFLLWKYLEAFHWEYLAWPFLLLPLPAAPYPLPH